MKYHSLSSLWFLSSPLLWILLNSGQVLVLGETLVDAATAYGLLDDFLAAAATTGQEKFWEEDFPLTLFAPSNKAFAALPNGAMECLTALDDGAPLNAILGFHVVVGNVFTMSDIIERTRVLSAIGVPLTFSVDDDSGIIQINKEATIIEMDLLADNGVMHLIDTVLIPPGMDLAELCPHLASGSLQASTNVTTTTTNISENVVEVASANGLDTFLAAAATTGQDKYWVGNLPLTLFAPSNEAFAELPDGTMECLSALDGGAPLNAILGFHVVVASVLTSTDLLDGTKILSGIGVPLVFTVDSATGTIQINKQATIVETNLKANNGVIHVIDTVLIPPGMDISILCPNLDSASSNSESGTMNHTNGTTTNVNTLTTTDPVSSTVNAATNSTSSSKNLVDVAITNGLNDVVDIAVATGQDMYWEGGPLLTLFAPSDEAFAALPSGTMECLKELKNGALDAILAYHVVVGHVWLSSNITNGTSLASAINETLTFTIDDSGTIAINQQATIVQTDLEAVNGVIHVIDTVLMPPLIVLGDICPSTDSGIEDNTDPTPSPTQRVIETEQEMYSLSTLGSLLKASGGFIVDPLGGDGPMTVFAPTDAAFIILDSTAPGWIQSLIDEHDVKTIQAILANHLIMSRISMKALEQGLQQVTSFAGETLKFTFPPPMVNDASVVTSDILCSNGLLHTIDKVLLPSTVTVGSTNEGGTVGDKSVTTYATTTASTTTGDTTPPAPPNKNPDKKPGNNHNPGPGIRGLRLIDLVNSA